MNLSEILDYLDCIAPYALQEHYDNSGLIVGNPADPINGALICVDVTEIVLAEAIEKKCNLIISHHPMVFSGMKKFTGSTPTERLVEKSIRNGISIVAMHTNLDNYSLGVNKILCEKLGIRNPKILRPLDGKLRKLVTFCPTAYSDKVRDALFEAGAGHIGNYDACSFNMPGKGSFRALNGSNPFVGNKNELHFENEDRIEVIYPAFLEKMILKALFSSHPYEEVAYDLYALSNLLATAGAGMIGELEIPADPHDFLEMVKHVISIGCIRHTSLSNHKISRIAVCGGSGSFLIPDALASGADIFLTGDIKYHDFFLPSEKMILADIGHYESEQFTKELICTLLKEKFPTFALLISEQDTNPINYL
jgi:dinuclear metal center YbgI/SA1388 family protein